MDAGTQNKAYLILETEPALTLSNIRRQFGSVCAVNTVSLDVKPGEIICLVGHSGCGKTSLLRIIAGIDAPDSGTLAMGGKTLVGPSVFVEPEKRNIGVVFQDYALFPHLTVRENVMFGLRKMKADSARKRVDELLELVGLSHMQERYPHMLSGGEQQRVALIRALAPKPDLLLMDEPFSNLDRGLRSRVRTETMALLRATGTPVIIVTHEAEEALSTGDRVVLMRSGEIIQCGSARDLYSNPNSKYSADFFCDFNAIPGTVCGNVVKSAVGDFPAPSDINDGGEVFVYLRPRDVFVMPVCSEFDDVFNGYIESRSYFGETEELVLRLDETNLVFRVRTEQEIPEMASRLSVRIDRKKAYIFKK